MSTRDTSLPLMPPAIPPSPPPSPMTVHTYSLPPPSYEEAIDPNFLSRIRPPQFSRITRKLLRKISRRCWQSQNEEPDDEDSPLVKCLVYFALCGVVCVPISMIVVGALDFGGLCWHIDSPYALWLIVGGVAAILTAGLSIYDICMDSNNRGLVFFIVVFTIFLTGWWVVGCYYLWIMGMHGVDYDLDLYVRGSYKSSRCAPAYYYTYALIVVGPIPIAYSWIFYIKVLNS